MKTKRTVFEVNDVYRVMENSELIYTLTNSEKLKREEYKYEQMEIEGLCLSDVLETLTPSRKKVAYAAIELYKRLKEGQVESPALLSSNNVYKMMHPVLCDIATEEMWVLLLNSSSKLIRKVRISCGGINTAPVDIRVIMKQALYYGEFYQFNLSSCIRQQNSLTAQFVSFSLSNLANIFYPPQFLQ